MNIPEENTFVEPWLDELAQRVIGRYYKDRDYSCSGITGNEIFFLDEKKNFLIFAGKKENETGYVIALKEISKEVNGGFATEVYSGNGDGSCRKLFSRTFMDPDYTRARVDAAKFARHLRDLEEILPELK